MTFLLNKISNATHRLKNIREILIFLSDIKYIIVANEKVVDAWDEAKLNFLPQPDTILINSEMCGSLQGLSLSK